MSKKSRHPDYLIFIFVAAILFTGILTLSSVSAPLSYDRYGVTDVYLKHQLIFGLIPGLAFGLVAYFLNIEWVRRNSFYAFILFLLLMSAVFLPVVGHSSGGASRWLKIGSYTFQPAEFLKLFFILYLSGVIAKTGEKFSYKGKIAGDKKTLFVFLAVISLTALLLLAQKDLSTLLVVVAIALAIYLYSGAPIKYLLSFGIGAVVLFAVLIYIEPYRISRIFTLFTDIDIMNEGYQVNQALISIGSGGLKGVGLGMSHQRYGFVPAAMSDAIFPIFAEENGFIGSIILIALFLAFSLCGFRMIRRISDPFSRYAALGITVWITFQALINITSMVRLMPILGIPLPFISYGGSALINEMIAIGLLLNMSTKQTTS